MSSPDRDEGLPLLSGDSADPRNTPPTSLLSAYTLSMRRAQLERIPEGVLRNSSLTYLCLEGNRMSSLPQSMFTSLPYLLWLDLRQNRITSLPAEIGSHRCLKTLLLEGNPISELPPELGNVTTLTGLNLRDCPISFPPQHILQQGLQVILQCLRSALSQQQVVTGKTSPEFPALEKLQLSELTCPDVDEDSVDEDDLQKFRELKEKLIQQDRTELGSFARGHHTSKSQILSRKKSNTETGVIPKLPLFDAPNRKMPKEWILEATRAQKEEVAVLEQRRKSNEALKKWRTKARLAQERTTPELRRKKLERQRKQEEEALASGLEDCNGAPPEEADRSVSVLHRQIRQHVEKMQQKHKNSKGSTTEQVTAAEEDVKQMARLQALVLEKRTNLKKELEKTLLIFDAEPWPDVSDK